MTKHEGKYTGWGIGKRPFSETEFKRSHLGSGKKASYSHYLRSYARVVVEDKRKTQRKKTKAKKRRASSGYSFDFGF